MTHSVTNVYKGRVQFLILCFIDNCAKNTCTHLHSKIQRGVAQHLCPCLSLGNAGGQRVEKHFVLFTVLQYLLTSLEH